MRIHLVPAVLLVSATNACAGDTPLVFGQALTVGITIAGTVPDQGGELTLGYKEKSIAVVPVQPSSKAPDANGTHEDALSVLGQFEVEAKAGSPSVSLGRFFATGLAAKTLADGFKAQLSK